MSLAICEPLLQLVESRFVMFPVKHTGLWDLYKKSKIDFGNLKISIYLVIM